MNAQLGPIFLYTKHLEKIASYYRDTLGIPIKSHEPGHALRFDTGSAALALHIPDPPGTLSRSWANGGLLLWLQVEDDLEQVASRLKRESAKLLTPVIQAGRRDLLLVRDPEGRRIGLYRERTA